jgi:hypothetical protein
LDNCHFEESPQTKTDAIYVVCEQHFSFCRWEKYVVSAKT